MDLTTSPDPGSKADSTELHRYAEGLLVSLAADGTAPSLPPGVADVPGYWLAPAVEALVLIMSGQDALEPLAQATHLDERRTALFLCLALAVCGRGDHIHASWLGTAFGELSNDRPVTSGQRALWLAAARGAYGPVGKIFVLRKLDAVVVPPEDELWLKALVPDEPVAAMPASLDGCPELVNVPEITASAHAVARLRRLRDRCAEITSAPQPAMVSKVDADAVWTDDEPLAVLRSLIGQENAEGPLSSLSGHLLHDVRPAADPHLAALALHVAAPAVKAAGESLTATIQAPPPDSVTVPILGYPITLRADGPEQASMAEAERRIVTEGAPQGTAPWLGYLVGGLAAVVFLVGFVTSFLVTLAGVALGGVSAFLIWRVRVQEQTAIRRVQTQVGELSDAADRGVRALREYGKESAARAETAADDLAELCRVLRRGPRAA
ncbi:hypothetical protein Pth03_69030 [Planotetraspora thailandica]|uniref:Uncharacterized protein n=1 Tax=Planotetraspora thailandica TaxID=487172 RepID=A0A8J4DDB8_9ACTN|nr:hypothetical protein [Planotetraspora thailandica]GII58514.1 hypothetical protein Pth03_69030 [Planotetraspora thailandica]